MTENQLLGTWRLVSFELRDAEGQAIYPYGQDAIGQTAHLIWERVKTDLMPTE